MGDGLSWAHAALSIMGYIYHGSAEDVRGSSLTVMGEDPFVLSSALL